MVQKDCQITSVNCPLCIQSYVFFFSFGKTNLRLDTPNISWFHSALFKFYADDSLVNTLSKRDAHHDGIYCYWRKRKQGWRSGESARLPPMWPGFKSRRPRHMWVEFAGGFSPGTPVFPSPEKPTFPNSNSTRNQVDEEPLCGCATCKSLFIYLFYIFIYFMYLFM